MTGCPCPHQVKDTVTVQLLCPMEINGRVELWQVKGGDYWVILNGMQEAAER